MKAKAFITQRGSPAVSEVKSPTLSPGIVELKHCLHQGLYFYFYFSGVGKGPGLQFRNLFLILYRLHSTYEGGAGKRGVGDTSFKITIKVSERVLAPFKTFILHTQKTLAFAFPILSWERSVEMDFIIITFLTATMQGVLWASLYYSQAKTFSEREKSLVGPKLFLDSPYFL